MRGSVINLVWPDGQMEKVKLVSTGKSGGAGEIFEIEKKPGYVAKIYHDVTKQDQLERYAKKIRWMVSNKPELPAIPQGCESVVQLAWPVAQVFRDSRFAGFLMEKIDFGRTMEMDYLLTRRQAEQEGFQVDFGKLMTVSYNLASILTSLHSKKIAVVDLKPMNLKVYKSELYVSILDCDGFHIYSETFSSDAPQVTPEYLAPEFHGVVVANPESQDWFALATIIFRLLNFGIHPYAGVSENRAQYPTELANRIKQGLYPYGQVAYKGVRAVPASIHEAFPDSIRSLFDRAFSWSPGGRPSAWEWTDTLGAYASRNSGHMTHCEKGHVQFAGKPCPSCLRESIIKSHVIERTKIRARIRQVPGKTLRHLQKSFNRTHTSPFQITLAQMQAPPGTVIPTSVPQNPAIPFPVMVRNSISVEILWILGLLVTIWWVK